MTVPRHMIFTACVTLLASACCSYGDVIDVSAPGYPPPGPGAHHLSVVDAFSIFGPTGYGAPDSNGDGFLDVSGSQNVNPVGYVLMHPFNWRYNVRWSLNQFPAMLMGPGGAGGGGGGGGAGGGMFGFDFGEGYWFPFDELEDYDYYFGQSENPDSDGLFGVDENPVPEPTALMLLTAGVIVPLGRRRI